jgi:16S rRNA processing protein RimM
LAVPRATRVFVGRFVKPFGIKGELKFVGSDDFWPEVLESKRLELRRPVDGNFESGPARIERIRPHGKHFVVKLEGVDDRDGSESQVGGELFIDTGDLDVDLPEYELPFQVLGLTIKTEDGFVVGDLKSVMFSAAHPVYIVEGEKGEIMIPAIPEFIVSKDDQAGEIVIRTIEGLLDG